MPRTLAGDLVDLVFPRRCAGCGTPGVALCRQCGASEDPPVVRDAAFGPIVAAQLYRDGIRAALIGYKERNRRDLTRALGGQLAVAVAAVLAASGVRGEQVVLVPVAGDPRAARARGGDHVVRLARVAAKVTGVPVVPALRQCRVVRDSARLGGAARALNLADSMRAGSPLAGRSALVVDDIVTTGATLAEAARALSAAGWPVAGAAVVATTALRSTERDRSVVR